ncbi:MAG TPA: hypothetical protein VFV38_04915 [Ktedonobacteraceae bacterium]|nr:hypothetical protein [Ktedonobacteraceae bacterium]
MSSKHIQVLRRSAQILGILALAIFMVGCENTLLPIPSSKLPSSTPPHSLMGNWQGCIRAENAVNEIIFLSVFEEKSDGTFFGKYNENYKDDFLFMAGDDRIANDVLTSKAQIEQNNNIQFSAAVQRYTSGDNQSNQYNFVYSFKGVLGDTGIMEGQVSEGEPGSPFVMTHVYNWELSNDGHKCPY